MELALRLLFDLVRPIWERRDPVPEFRRFELESIVANARPEFDDLVRWLKKLLRRPPFDVPCRNVVLLRFVRPIEFEDRVLDKLRELFCCEPKLRRTLLGRLVCAGRLNVGATLRMV
ncbi:MAG: hypothetical protein DHS20C16_17150 [Phycisphaerae bacterium]|nr:MAG: hypothetical protein DHS20C16_17150 [Phycisphaerae bacterium]